MWTVLLARQFADELATFHPDVRQEILAYVSVLEQFGPTVGRPKVDTLNGSKHANMKEMRFEAARGVWRVAFAFDPQRQAVLLVAGDKGGTSEGRFYRRLIATADARFDAHLAALKKVAALKREGGAER